MVVTKEEIRKELLSRRQSLPSGLKDELDTYLRSKLLSLPELIKAEKVLLFCPIKGEPDLSQLFEEILSQGKGLVLPRVRGKELELIKVYNPICLSAGTFNIPEPTDGKRIYPEELDVAVVPGIAFDREGYRIGFGKGYYDRLLERVSCPVVGVAYSFQVLDRVPRDPWDKPVDILITEKEVMRWNR